VADKCSGSTRTTQPRKLGIQSALICSSAIRHACIVTESLAALNIGPVALISICCIRASAVDSIDYSPLSVSLLAHIMSQAMEIVPSK
jgi:hypothetical protein